MAISAQMVKALRDKTGAGMMDCKKALVEVNGDEEQAIAWLREKGLSKAAKKAGRATSEGLVGSHVAGPVGALVEVKCETDFVARGEKFQDFAQTLAKQVADAAPATREDFLAMDYAGDVKGNVEQVLTEMISVIGENMQVGRLARFELEGPGGFGLYIHSNGKIGVLVEILTDADPSSEEFQQAAKDVAMQIAAANPVCISPDQVPADLLAKEKEIYKNQAMEEGKPEQIAEKIVMGRISKFYKEICLLEQPFIKDDKMAVKDVLKKLGKDAKIGRFARLALGEDAPAEEA